MTEMPAGSPAAPTRASIVIRTFNSEATIDRVLEGVFSQTFTDYEVVVVDSGSTDGTLEIVGRYPHVLVDYSGERFTYSGSLNAGISASSGEYAVCLSSHCTPLHGEWLGALVGAMDSDERLAGAWGPLVFGAGEATGDRGVETVDLDGFYRRPNYGLQNSNSIVRRALWEERPFSTEVPTCEDQDWARHFLERGYLTAQVKGAPVTYRILQGPYEYGRKVCREFLTLNELFGYRPETAVTDPVRRLARLAGAAVLGRRAPGVSLRIAAGLVGSMVAGWIVRYRELWGRYGGGRARTLGRERARQIAATRYRWAYLTLEGVRRTVFGSESRRGPEPGKMLWIFGSGRSGSTWLRSMMGEFPGHRVWEEPLVGRLFGDFYATAQKGQLGSANFIMSDETRKGWIRSVRSFVLDGATYAQPRLSREDHLVIKEPNGSVGAPLIMEALPESSMILLLRDPRDVVASVLDGARRGSWLYQWGEKGSWKRDAVADESPDDFVEKRARIYLRDAGAAARAYEEHGGPKSLVRYEELVAEPFATMRRLYFELGISVYDRELQQAVEKHSWANIPEEKKGEGKFYRKGVSGGWKEDLTSEQVEIVERVAEPLLREFYSD